MKTDEFFNPKLINLFCNSRQVNLLDSRGRLKYNNNNIKQEKDESAVYADDKYKHTEKSASHTQNLMRIFRVCFRKSQIESRCSNISPKAF